MFISILIISYIIGSISAAYLLGKLFKGIDIRNYGSGNLGATNAFRVMGKYIALCVLIFDTLKSFIVLLFANYFLDNLFPYQILLIGLFAVLGHIFPVFLRFHGGKGVATLTGVFLYISPLEFLFSFVIFIFVLLIKKYVSLASILSAALFPVLIFINISNKDANILYWNFAFAVFSSSIIILMHRKNIIRLINNNENKLKFR